MLCVIFFAFSLSLSHSLSLCLLNCVSFAFSPQPLKTKQLFCCIAFEEAIEAKVSFHTPDTHTHTVYTQREKMTLMIKVLEPKRRRRTFKDHLQCEVGRRAFKLTNNRKRTERNQNYQNTN